MGASVSRIEDGRALQLSRERKRLIKQAINRRHALAKSHIAYIGSLRNLGNALERLIEPETAVESSPCGSTSTIVLKPLELATKESAQDMKNRTSQQKSRRLATKKPKTPSSETIPWDYFHLVNPNKDNFPSGRVAGEGLEKADALRQFAKEKATHNLGVQEEGFLPASKRKFLNIDLKKSPELSPLRALPSRFGVSSYVEEITIVDKDKKLGVLNAKVTESGQDVYHLIEAKRFRFHPPLTPRGRSMSSGLLKSCFSFKDPGNAKEGTSALMNNNVLLEGHISTLDRLYAWERKLYNEVKASLLGGKKYDMKCKFLRDLESKETNRYKIDRTRSNVKDLHSQVIVGVHRINTISKKIEELRDNELNPELMELINGLKKMWEVMYECHKAQLNLVSMINQQTIVHLEVELSFLSSCFSKWLIAQKWYVQAISMWLFRCASIHDPKMASRRRKADHRQGESPLDHFGPTIYTTCGVWLELLDTLPIKEVIGSSVKKMENECGQQRLVSFFAQLSYFAECCVYMFSIIQNDIHETKNICVN